MFWIFKDIKNVWQYIKNGLSDTVSKRLRPCIHNVCACCTNPADNSSSSDCLQGSWQAEDPPVSLSQLNHLAAHVLKTDTVSPLQGENTHWVYSHASLMLCMKYNSTWLIAGGLNHMM